MGDEIDEASEPLSDNLIIGMPGVAEEATALAGRHGFETSAELEELIDKLFGLSCRDQDNHAFDPKRMAERRKQGYKLAKSMQSEAVTMLKSLARLHRDYRAFYDQVSFNPALLNAIFNADTAGPENLVLPPELIILETLFEAVGDESAREFVAPSHDLGGEAPSYLDRVCPPRFWEAVDVRLQAVADLPIRARLPRGPVPNAVIRSALVACRSYWVGANRSWSMSALKMPEVRHENQVHALQGKCEMFVADALEVSGIRFNLSELHSSWEYVDAKSRRQNL